MISDGTSELLAAIRDLEATIAATATKHAYSVREAAARLSVSESHVRKLIADGVIRPIPHMGGRVVIAHIELDRVCDST